MDLRDRALRTSRRLAVRRTLLTSSVALVILVGISIVALARHGGGQAVVPTDPSPTHSMSPSPITSQTTSTTLATDFNFPAPPPSATGLAAWKSTSAQSLPGRAYLLAEGATAAIAVLGDGQVRTSSLGALGLTSCILNSIVFSPDGTHVAWVRGDVFGDGGQLVSIDLGTRRSSAIGEGASCAGGSGPKWRPDSRSVIFDQSAGTTVTVSEVSLNTGATTALPREWWGYRAMVPDFNAHAGSINSVVIEDASGAVVRTVTYDGYGTSIGLSVQGISYDGRYVGLSHRNTDQSVVRSIAVVIDTSTGQKVKLPIPAEEQLMNVKFVRDGGMLVQSRRSNGTLRLSLVAANGTVTASISQTGAISTALLMGYVP